MREIRIRLPGSEATLTLKGNIWQGLASSDWKGDFDWLWTKQLKRKKRKNQGGDDRKRKGRETLKKLMGKFSRGGTEERVAVRWCERCMNRIGESSRMGFDSGHQDEMQHIIK